MSSDRQALACAIVIAICVVSAANKAAKAKPLDRSVIAPSILTAAGGALPAYQLQLR